MKTLRIAPALVLSALSANAVGQPKEVNRAVSAFDQAERLLAAGRLDEACARYSESYALDPQLGALLHVADCNERIHKYATAWKAFEEGRRIALEKKDERAEVARERADALLPRLSYVRIVARDPKGATEVRLDGKAIDASTLADKIPVDGGSHAVVAILSNGEHWETSATVDGAGSVQTIEIPAPEVTPARAEPSAAAPAPPGADSGTSGGASVQTIGGWAAIGLGAVSLGLSGYFFASKASKAGEADDLQRSFQETCAGDGLPVLVAVAPQCTPGSSYEQQTNADLNRLEDEQRTARTAGLVTAIAGGALVTGGVLLLLTRPRSNSENGLNLRPEMAPAMVMLTASGRFW